MEVSFWQWVAICAAAFGTGMGKGGLPGLGNFAIAVYAFSFPAKLSVGILLPVLIAADLVAVIVYRRHADWRIIAKLLPWTLLGVFVGALVFHRIDDRTVEILIGAILLIMTLLHFVRSALNKAAQSIPEGRTAASLQISTGLIGGFATFLANAAGPVAALYLIFLRLPKMVFVGTLAWFFMIVNWAKLPVMIGIGNVTVTSLQISLLPMAFAMIGVLAARAVIGFIPQRLFELLIWLLITAAALQLLF